MTKQDFQCAVTELLGQSPKKINTNNAWGYGGCFGIGWTVDGDCPVTVTVAEACCRSERFNTDFIRVVCRSRGIRCDLEQSPKNFDAALRAVRDSIRSDF